MKTLDIITGINTYLKTENKAILTDLLNALQNDYRYEEAKRSGGNSATKRLKAVERVLKANMAQWKKHNVGFPRNLGISYFEAEAGKAILCPIRL